MTTTLTPPHLLSKIDALFACNTGHHIPLPQIVVVGDQSSGKSSVLEGLTRLPFPRDSGLCTRFATQITFRRAPAAAISVAVIPGKDASGEHVEAVRAWKREVGETLGAEAFGGIMREVQEVMGIGPGQTFSSDVLRIEVAGPQQQHLTVIDVPGIFQRVTRDVTTKEDKDFVAAMVADYMRNPRSVMLTVVPANVDVATQLILEMAEEVDREGQRTLGVMTKPDLVDKGAEGSVVDMVEGRSHELLLGWCLVRNPGQKEVEDPEFDRDAAEKAFFRSVAPWSGLPKDRVGVDALRERLQDILATHIRREFPAVKSEVSKKLKECKRQLEVLGPKRDTQAEQARYLIDMATQFQNLTNQALDAKYTDSCFLEYPALKIATLVVNRNEVLSENFEKYGHTYQFNNHPDKNETDGASIDFGGDDDDDEDTRDTETVDPGLATTTRLTKTVDDLEDIVYRNHLIAKPKQSGILDWMTNVYNGSRGFELGGFDPTLLATTMKAQSKNWESLAFGYVSDVVTMTHNFIDGLLILVCPEINTRMALKSVLMDKLLSAYKEAFNQVDFILKVERYGVPTTLNHYFNDNLEKCRQERFHKDAAANSFTMNGMAKGPAVVYLDNITKIHPMSNKQHTIQDLHDILRSYYKVARKRIVDTLCMQATAYHLISGPHTPLKLFSPTLVSQLSADQLEEIAGEDASVKRRRAQLLREQEDLEKGRQILS